MRERVHESAWSLVVFTVCAQAAAGLALTDTPAVALALLALGGLVVLAHLGRPARARFAVANMRSSWLSRESLLGLAFAASLLLWLAVASPLRDAVAGLSSALGLLFVVAIAGVYRLRTVPAWDRWTTPASFFGTMLVLGAAIGGYPLLAACATAAQLLVTLASPIMQTEQRSLLLARFGTALLGAGLLVAGFAPLGTSLLVVSELVGRYLFYASHRRVGL